MAVPNAIHEAAQHAAKLHPHLLAAPGGHTAETVIAEMDVARPLFEQQWQELETLLPRLRKAHGDPLAFRALVATVRTKLSWAADFVLEAHFGKTQSALVQAAEYNDACRASGKISMLRAVDAEADNFVPLVAPAAAARMLNARDGFMARTDEELVELGKRVAPIGSIWQTAALLTTLGRVVGHGQAGYGPVTIEWVESGKRTGFGPESFNEARGQGRWLRRCDLSDEEKSQVPVGSLWRHGSHTFEIVGYDDECGSIKFRNVNPRRRSKYDREDTIWAFIGSSAYMQRKVARS